MIWVTSKHMMAAMHCSLFVFFVSFLALTTANVCTRLDSEDIPPGLKPVMDFPTFSADVEIYKKEVNIIESMKLYYDALSATVRLTVLQNINEHDFFFLFNSNELLTFVPSPSSPRGFCGVDSNMKDNPYLKIIGGPYYDQKRGKYWIPPVLDVFHFTGKDAKNQDIIQQYVRMTKIRDKDVYEFTSCQNWESTEFEFRNFTANVTHYFTAYQATSNWKYPDKIVMPVSMHVTGQSDGVAFDQTWNFFNVKPRIPPFILETPPGVTCHGRKSPKPFPKLPSFFKVSYEVIDNVYQSYHIANEIYDYSGGIIVYQKAKSSSKLNPADRKVTINDYFSGLSYQIDEVTKQCIIKNITNTTSPFYFTDKGEAKIVTPQMFFMAKNATFTYQGTRIVRGVSCETWVANTYNMVLGNVVVEWYFALPGTKSWNSESHYKDFQIPVKCKIWPNQDPLSIKVSDSYCDINVFHVDYTKIWMNAISIKPCMTSSPSNLVQIKFPDALLKIPVTNYQEMEWDLLLTIASKAQVRWLRISDFKLAKTKKDVVAIFELLDAPPYRGNADTKPEPSLADATQALKDALGSQTIWLNAIPSDPNKDAVKIVASPKASIQPLMGNQA